MLLVWKTKQREAEPHALSHAARSNLANLTTSPVIVMNKAHLEVPIVVSTDLPRGRDRG